MTVNTFKAENVRGKIGRLIDRFKYSLYFVSFQMSSFEYLKVGGQV